MKKIKILLFLMYMTFLLQFSFPAMIANETGRGFLPGTSIAISGVKDVNSINLNIIEGGGYYLNAYSDFLLFLNKVEMSALVGLNYEDAFKIVNGAVVNMENAKASYLKLTNIADVTPYDPNVIEQLINFNYASFQVSKNLPVNIFKIVESFLVKGDIRGVYHKLYEDVSEIHIQLCKIKAGLEKKELIAITELWNINQKYVDSIFFGQYVANVFYEII